MQITAVKYKPVNIGKLVGEATITIDDQFEIDAKIIDGIKGKFLAYPSREYMKGTEKKTWALNRWKTHELSDAFCAAVLKRIPELSGSASGGF